MAQANFEAEIRLDISPFIASIQKAQSEVAKLSQQLDALNKKTVSPRVNVGGAAPTAAGSVETGVGSQARMAAAKEEIRLQEELVKTERARGEARNDQQKQQERNLARERYALYDVAAAYTAVAGAASAAVFATAGTAINFERAFVDVSRTTDFVSAKIGAAAESAKNDLKSLAAEIPVAFGQITQIATIGNQLGIAQGALTSFTETVAKFSATTGVTVDSTAMSFGRIGELLQVPAQDFERMGSAIAFAGVNAVATEEQILSVTKEIATTAKMAKFSSADIIGLSTALSSLGIAPEAARGSIIRTFAGINKVISEGGAQLEQYASIAGMSAQEFASTWQENGQVAFGALLRGLQGLSNQGENLDSVLRGLGMRNVRDIQTVQKLGDNYDVYTSSIKDANQGFKEGTFLGQAYGQIQETVASKLLLVQNNIANLLDTLGQGAVGDVFKAILDVVNETLIRLNQFAKTPLGQVFGGFVTIGGAVVALIASINAVSALAQASLRAFATAQDAILQKSPAVNAGLATMNAQLQATTVAANTATVGLQKKQIVLNALNTAFKAIRWTVIIGLITHAISQMAIQFSSAEQKAESMLGGFSGLQDALTNDLTAYNTALTELGGNVTAAKEATGVISELNTQIQNNNGEINKNIDAQNALNDLVGLGANNASTLSTEFENLNFVIGENTRQWVANAIAQSDAFQKLSQNTDAMRAITDAGFNLDTALRAAASGNLDQYLGNISETAIQSASAFEAFTKEMYDSGNIIGYLISLIPRLINEITNIFGIDLFPVSAGIDAIRNTTQGAVNQMKLFGANLQQAAQTDMQYLNESLDEMEKNSKGAAKALRTVVDYANDLRTVFSRAFEIRFGQQESLDAISQGWNNIAEKAASATDAIKKANDEIAELTADRSILEYQLTVAERYGDEQRAAVIRAKIAKIDTNVANKKEDIKTATDDLTKSTKGDTEAAIENRRVLLDQVNNYASLIEMYAKTGMKGKELKDRVKELRREFVQQGLDAGYSREQLQPYIKAFDDIRQTINKTPRNVDIQFKANVSPAEQAVREFIAKLKNTTGTLKINADLDKTRLIKAAQDQITYLQMDRAIIARFGKSTAAIDAQIAAARQHLNKVLNLADGGLVTGPGGSTSDSIPAMLSNGEFVVKAAAVSTYGVDFLNALNQQKIGAFTAGSSPIAASSSSTVAYLSPEDRALLRAAIDRPVNLYTENAKIASSANAGNVILAQRGTK